MRSFLGRGLPAFFIIMLAVIVTACAPTSNTPPPLMQQMTSRVAIDPAAIVGNWSASQANIQRFTGLGYGSLGLEIRPDGSAVLTRAAPNGQTTTSTLSAQRNVPQGELRWDGAVMTTNSTASIEVRCVLRSGRVLGCREYYTSSGGSFSFGINFTKTT